MAFIKFLFITFLIIYLLRLVAPVLMAWLFRAFFKRMAKKGQFQGGTFYYGGNQQQQQRNYSQKSSGNVRVDYIPEQPDRKDFRGGEYVDYEEVK